MKRILSSPLKLDLTLASVLLLILVACGNNQPNSPTSATVFPKEVVPVSHPDLTGLEDKIALPTLEDQKKALADILAKTDATPKQKAEAYGRVGALYMAFSYRDTAEVCLRNAYVLQPENFLYSYILGHLYKETSQPEQAIAFFESAYNLKKDDIPATYYYAESLRNSGQTEKARTLFQEILTSSPETVHAHLGLGKIEAAAENHEEALKHFGAILARQARASAVHYYMADSYKALGNTEEAQKHLALHGEIQPYLEDPHMEVIYQPRALTHYIMAENMRLAGLNSEAVEHYDLVVKLDPTNPGPRMGRALNLIGMGNHFEAVLNMQDDITVLPNMLAIHHILARLSAASDDDRVRNGTRALTILSNLKNAGITAELTETLAMAYAEVGRFEDAILAQEKAIEMAKEAKDETFAARLAAAIPAYREKKPCREPWPKDDPLFKMVTINK